MAGEGSEATDGAQQPTAVNEKPVVWWKLTLDAAFRPRRVFANQQQVPLWLAIAVGAVAESVGMVSARFADLVGSGTPTGEALAETLAAGAAVLMFAPVGLFVTAVGLHVCLWALKAQGRSFKTSLTMAGMARSIQLVSLPLWALSLALSPVSIDLAYFLPTIGLVLTSVWGLVVLGIFVSSLHGFGVVRSAVAVLAPILMSVVGALVLRTQALEAFKIPAASMWPTLHVQDHVFVTKSGYDPKRGDLIVFEYPKPPGDPSDPQDFVKRLVGLPGDTIVVQDGRPIVNGKEARRCEVGSYSLDGRALNLNVEFLDTQAYLIASDLSQHRGQEGPYALGPDEVFVLGDNRDNSHDSRAWSQGPGVPLDNIKGRVWIIWLSFQRATQAIAWSRVGLRAHGPPTLPPDTSPELKARLGKCLEGWTAPD